MRRDETERNVMVSRRPWVKGEGFGLLNLVKCELTRLVINVYHIVPNVKYK